MSIKVLIDTSPLSNASAIRGIGSYTRHLTDALEKEKSLEVMRSSLADKNFKPDIIHYPFFDLFFHTLPLRKKATTVVTIHDTIPLVFPEQYKPGKRGLANLIRQKLALKSVAAVITDSESSKKDIVHYFKYPADKIYVIPLASNPDLKAADEKRIRSAKRRYKLPSKYLLYVGDINYNKNLPQLIKTLKFLPKDIKLVLLGKNFTPQEIPEWQWIESQVALSNVEDRIIYLDNVLGDASEDLSAIYSGALAYIQPSLYEGFGLPVLEAMQCKTPVISSANSSLLEIGGKAVLFTEEETAEEFAKKVEEILNWTKKERTSFINKAYKWSQRFSWEKTAKKTAELYQKLLS